MIPKRWINFIALFLGCRVDRPVALAQKRTLRVAPKRNLATLQTEFRAALLKEDYGRAHDLKLEFKPRVTKKEFAHIFDFLPLTPAINKTDALSLLSNRKINAVAKGNFLEAGSLKQEIMTLKAKIADDNTFFSTLKYLKTSDANDANRYSQLHTLHGQTPTVENDVAVFITGQLRLQNEDHLNHIKMAVASTDCFIVTYSVYHNAAANITNNTLFINVRELSTTPYPRAMWQWLQLSRGLHHWRNHLDERKYHTICRYRTDVRLPTNFAFHHCIGRTAANDVGIVYARSDYMFYAAASTFIRLFTPMINASLSSYSKTTASKEETSRYRDILQAHGGIREACLNSDAYAPAPRESPLQTTAFVVVPKKAGRQNTIQVSSDLGLPELMQRRRELQSLVKTQKLINLFCGCKYTVGTCRAPPWKGCQGGGHQDFQSEPAFT